MFSFLTFLGLTTNVSHSKKAVQFSQGNSCRSGNYIKILPKVNLQNREQDHCATSAVPTKRKKAFMLDQGIGVKGKQR